MRRLTIYAASLATIGFVGGVLMGTPRSTHDHVLQDSVRADEANADPERTFSPFPRPQPKPVGGSAEVREEPQRDSEPAREPSNGEAVGVTGPDLPDSALRRAIELYRKGDLLSGDRVRTELTDPLERTLTAWVAVRFAPIGFDRLTAFSRDNPDWPVMAALGRRAEEALLVARKPASAVRAFFSEQLPTTAEGKVALALAVKADGGEDEAASLIRDAWRNHTFGGEIEARILSVFSGLLNQDDHRERMERFLLKENWPSAFRAASYVGKDYGLVAKARIAVAQKAQDAGKALEAVPTAFRSDGSYLLAKAQFLRRQGKLDEAIRALGEVSLNAKIPAAGDQWWVERRLIARELLDRGDAYTAYAIARDHAAESADKRIDAEFHSGWIALRFLKHPATAASHFAKAAQFAKTPISVARILYWQGRTAEALGDDDAARSFYEKAGGYSITYYGQLARTKLGLPQVELRAIGNDGFAAFEALPVAQAVKRLYALGYSDIAFTLCTDLAASLADARQLDALGHLIADQGDGRTLLAVGKAAVQRGYPMDAHAFPLLGVPTVERVGTAVDGAMVYAVTRQESAFAPEVQSSAGAQGLMQLMPDTARRTARRFGVDFDAARLLEPAYNAKLGTAHLGELIEDWKGFPVLMFAAYNAGGGNVSKWIKAYGDPRSPKVDPIDWVERIPFSETRNYVQRVMESMLVYQHRLRSQSATVRSTETASSQPNLVP